MGDNTHTPLLERTQSSEQDDVVYISVLSKKTGSYMTALKLSGKYEGLDFMDKLELSDKIVKSVNNHDLLVEALKALVEAHENDNQSWGNWAKAREALSKAE